MRTLYSSISVAALKKLSYDLIAFWALLLPYLSVNHGLRVVAREDTPPVPPTTATFSSSSTPEFHSGADSSANQCFSFGCPFLPRDVFYDEDAKKALQRLREPQQTVSEAQQLKQSTESHLSELDSSGDRHRTTMTLCGYKGGPIQGQINQDRSILVSPFLQEFQILGVLDGHGKDGEIVSEYARLEIPKQLAAKLTELSETVNLMQLNTPEATDAVSNILKEVFLNVDKTAPDAANTGGCTASVALQLGSKLFIANAGDSVTMVGAHRGWNETAILLKQTREDKPHLEDERKRVEAAGGRVQIPQSFADGDSSRVVFIDKTTNVPVGLAMSRSIGDWEAPGVTAEPIVDVLDLKELYQTVLAGKDEFDCDNNNEASIECGPSDVNIFIVSASDGLMDFVTPQAIMEKFAPALFGKPELNDKELDLGSDHAHLAAEELIYDAAKGWYAAMQGAYRDDITIAAAKVFPWEES